MTGWFGRRSRNESARERPRGPDGTFLPNEQGDVLEDGGKEKMAAPKKIDDKQIITDLESKLGTLLREGFERSTASQPPVDLFRAVEEAYGDLSGDAPAIPTQNQIDAYLAKLRKENDEYLDQEKIATLKIAIGYVEAKNAIKFDKGEYLQRIKNQVNPGSPSA